MCWLSMMKGEERSNWNFVRDCTYLEVILILDIIIFNLSLFRNKSLKRGNFSQNLILRKAFHRKIWSVERNFSQNLRILLEDYRIISLYNRWIGFLQLLVLRRINVERDLRDISER